MRGFRFGFSSVFGSGPASRVRGAISWSLLVLMVKAPLCPAHAQGAGSRIEHVETEIVETEPGRDALTETARRAWGLSETDWQTYTDLMNGPAGLWYSHLAPAFVLGLYAETEPERERFARIVHEQERRRLDALFAFNRAYSRISRAERARPGFRFFGDFDPPGNMSAFSSLSAPSIRDAMPARILAFVGPDCPGCERTVRHLAASGRAFDIYYVGARSNGEISRWARNVGLSASRVLDRTITLNHDAGALARAGLGRSDLPVLFRDPTLSARVSLESALSR